MNEFFMVWCEGGRPPTCCHYARQSAEKEAERLALKEGKPFYVLHAQTKIEPAPKVLRTDLTLPF